ncbi:MAG: hypothetical protein HY647_12205, partial [Acidobacteria bacterium]|nr:hypothetical protein [Acidobacteriota bacterium]
LYYHQQLNMKEIATILNVHESRVSQLHSAAIARLRQVFSSTTSPNPPRVEPRRAPAAAGTSHNRCSKYFTTACQSSSVSTPMVSSAVSST